MRQNILLSILVLICLMASFSSCVPTKKVIYLQDTADQKRTTKPEDETKLIDSAQVGGHVYKIRAGDILSVRVRSLSPEAFNFFEDKTDSKSIQDPLLNGYLVNDSGYINLPIVDPIQLNGLTLDEATKKLTAVISTLLESPRVQIKVLNFTFTVLGEVQNQGRFTTYEYNLNLLQALGMAGGLTEFADREHIKLVRYNEGVASVYNINVLEDKFLSSPQFFIHPNDQIIISPLKTKEFRKYALANASFVLSALTAITLIFIRL